jgi:hypothetical protein
MRPAYLGVLFKLRGPWFDRANGDVRPIAFPQITLILQLEFVKAFRYQKATTV